MVLMVIEYNSFTHSFITIIPCFRDCAQSFNMDKKGNSFLLLMTPPPPPLKRKENKFPSALIYIYVAIGARRTESVYLNSGYHGYTATLIT